jgi:hypothetical protein
VLVPQSAFGDNELARYELARIMYVLADKHNLILNINEMARKGGKARWKGKSKKQIRAAMMKLVQARKAKQKLTA